MSNVEALKRQNSHSKAAYFVLILGNKFNGVEVLQSNSLGK